MGLLMNTDMYDHTYIQGTFKVMETDENKRKQYLCIY